MKDYPGRFFSNRVTDKAFGYRIKKINTPGNQGFLETSEVRDIINPGYCRREVDAGGKTKQ